MKKIYLPIYFICFLVAIVGLSLMSKNMAWAQGETEDEEKTVIELRERAPTKTEVTHPLVGMEAFKEVLASGTYLVGPGDEFLIFATGMEKPQETPVLSEGGLFIPLVGKVQVGGLRLTQAHEKIKAAFRGTVKVGQIQVELSKLRHFPVSVVGLVQEPGVHRGNGVTRVSEMIAISGGLQAISSRRNIRLFKTASLDPSLVTKAKTLLSLKDYNALLQLESHRVDLSLFKATGISAYNPFVEDGDIVVVPAKMGEIGAMEAVQRPGFYEFVQGDHISDLMTLALGVAPNYDENNAYLFRYGQDMTDMLSGKIDLAAFLEGEEQANLPLEAGDWLVIKGLTGYHNRNTVQIVGEVAYPGYYVVDKGTRLSKAITNAGGFTEKAALAEARVVRQTSEVSVQDPEYDRIRWIPPSERTEDDNQYFIMKTREKPGQMVVDFVALFEENDELQDIKLLPGDAIVVPKLRQTVIVSGAAANPGSVIFDPDYSVWDYIDRAGGYGWRASKDVRVIKARTGQIKRAKDVLTIDPGDRIWIKEKPVRDYWMVFTQAMGVIGQVTTIVLLYATLTSQ